MVTPRKGLNDLEFEKFNRDGEVKVFLIDTLQELLGRLSILSSVVANTAQIRAVVTGAVTATGGGYITSAQEVTALATQTTSLIAALNAVKVNNDPLIPVMANVNNCIGA